MHTLLENVYRLLEENKTDTAMDTILAYCDGSFTRGRFYRVDEALDQVDLNKIPITLMLSFLMCSAWAKPELKNRDDFYLKVEKKILETEKQERTERLLGGLK